MKFEINLKEIEEGIKSLSECGSLEEGGVYRGLYTPEWLCAVEKARELMEKAGLSTHIDAVGNLFGKLKGIDKSKRTILTGSHIDTVPNGGNFDGALGIIAGISAIKFLLEKFGLPKINLEVVAICEEEGSRFNTALWGARAILGMLSPRDASKYYDRQGRTIADAMKAIGFQKEKIPNAARTDIKAFLELHIEQGRVLEKNIISVGIVEAITGVKQFMVKVIGTTDHAGTTPMILRKDALRSAGEMISQIGIIAEEIGSPAVATVGQISVKPGARNVVPGEVSFTVDLRHSNTGKLKTMEERLISILEEIAKKRKTTFEIANLIDEMPVIMNRRLVEILRKLAKKGGINFCDIISGAGHDSAKFGRVVDTAMIFVPSKNGKSHCPEEFTDLKDICSGIKLLVEVLYKLAY